MSYSSSSAVYNVPPLITAQSQTTYKLAEVSLLDTTYFSYFSDQNSSVSNVGAAFDKTVTSVYGSPNSVCWIGVDFGSGLGASVSRIRFFPSLDWTNTAQHILNAVFQGSNDMSSWTNLGVIDQTVHSGYNTILSVSSAPYRYVRFLHNSTSKCNLA